MTDVSALDVAGRRRSPATMPGYHAGRPPRNKGMQYPADPPTLKQIVAVMRHTGENRHGWRLRAMIVVLWRAGLRVQEALALTEHDLDPRRGSLLVRTRQGRPSPRGRDGRVGLGTGAPVALSPAHELPSGAAVLHHRRAPPAAGRGQAPRCAASSAQFAARAGVRRHFRAGVGCATRTRLNSRARACR